MPDDFPRPEVTRPSSLSLRELPGYIRSAMLKVKREEDSSLRSSLISLCQEMRSISSADVKEELKRLGIGPYCVLDNLSSARLAEHLMWHEASLLRLAIISACAEAMFFLKHGRLIDTEGYSDINKLLEESKKKVLWEEDPELLREFERVQRDWESALALCQVTDELWSETDEPVLVASMALDTLAKDAYGARSTVLGVTPIQGEDVKEWVLTLASKMRESKDKGILDL